MADISLNTTHAAAADLATGIMNDLAALRAAILLLTAKLDLDVGVTDVNFAATCNPTALTTIA